MRAPPKHADAAWGLDRRTVLKATAASMALGMPAAQEDLIGILMTQRLWDPDFLAIHHDFWTSAYQAIDD